MAEKLFNKIQEQVKSEKGDWIFDNKIAWLVTLKDDGSFDKLEFLDLKFQEIEKFKNFGEIFSAKQVEEGNLTASLHSVYEKAKVMKFDIPFIVRQKGKEEGEYNYGLLWAHITNNMTNILTEFYTDNNNISADTLVNNIEAKSKEILKNKKIDFINRHPDFEEFGQKMEVKYEAQQAEGQILGYISMLKNIVAQNNNITKVTNELHESKINKSKSLTQDENLLKNIVRQFEKTKTQEEKLNNIIIELERQRDGEKECVRSKTQQLEENKLTLKQLQDRLTDINVEKSKNEDSINKVEIELGSYNSHIKKIKISITDLETEITKLQDASSDYEARIKIARENLKIAQNKLAEIKTKIDYLTKVYNDFENDTAARGDEARIEIANQKKLQYEKMIETLKESLKNKSEQYKQIQEDINEIETEHNEVKDNIERKKIELSDLEKNNIDLNSKIKELEIESSKLKTSCSAFKNANKSIENEIAQFKEKIINSEEDLVASKTKFDLLSIQLQDQKEYLVQLEIQQKTLIAKKVELERTNNVDESELRKIIEQTELVNVEITKNIEDMQNLEDSLKDLQEGTLNWERENNNKNKDILIDFMKENNFGDLILKEGEGENMEVSGNSEDLSPENVG
ncbi:MAG TPA: hypothetical protein QKA14_00710 [Candidatus Megaira endosymbiont of Hartmannula sinica]|nr:hypothetical protein [Candidatus Megaera endosymbiont of Hartmannula sinica]